MKKKALVLAVCLAISAPAISVAKALPADIVGLNLGDIQTSSYVGQKFEGIIPILFSNEEEANKLSVRLAPASIFQQIGAERLPFLESLDFQVTTKNHQPVVIVRSSRAIDMPFLNFVLEVTSPQGVVFQDYTVLVDPPSYQSFRADAVKPATLSKPVKAKKSTSLSLSKTQNTRYKVSSGDTLSKIAAALKTSQISLKRMVDVIHANNPKAFVNNDINKLKRGVYLKIPSANKIKAFKFNLADKSVKAVVEKATPKATAVANQNLAQHTVKKGDTLFEITKKFGHESISFTKRMSEIHKANPQAFSNNRINVLKVGATLTIPYVRQVAESKNTTNSEQVQATTVAENNADTVKQTKPTSTKLETETLELTEETEQAEVADGDLEFLASGIADAVEIPVAKPVIAKPKAANSSEKINSVERQKNLDVIKNLERRVRELRNSLEDSKSQLFHLKEVLKTKDVEIRTRNREIKTLKIDVKELEAELFEEKPVIENNGADVMANESVQSNPVQKVPEDVIASVESPEISAPEEETIEDDYYMESDPFVPDAEEVDMESLTPKVLLDQNKQAVTDNEIVSLLKELSFGGASAGFLVVLLALGLITYRRRLYSYVRIVPKNDHPNFYPPEKEAEADLVIEDLFKNVDSIKKQQDTIVTATAIPETTTKVQEDESTDEFSGSTLEECDNLISELSEELQVDKNIATESEEEWDEIEKICDQYIEKIKEEEISDLLDNSNAQKQEITFEEMVEDLIEDLDEEAKQEGVVALGELQKLKFSDKLAASGPSSNFREIMGYK